MSETQRRGLARVAAVVVITVAAVYLFQLAGLALATRQARLVAASQWAQVAALATQAAALETAAANASSDADVERWARERQWARPGDHVLAPGVSTAVPALPTPAPTPGDSSLDRLWRWLRNR
jgi:hypothetical protein